MKKTRKNKVAALAAAMAVLMTVSAMPASAIGKCPGVGGWTKYVETDTTATWYMKDGSVIVTDLNGKVISSTQTATAAPAVTTPTAPTLTIEEKVDLQVKEAAVKAGLKLGDWNHEYEQKVFDLVNAEREKLGIPKLVWAKGATEDAQIRAKELSVKYSHERPNGEPKYWENIAPGSPLPQLLLSPTCEIYSATHNATPEQVVADWMSSTEGHRENMMRYEVDDAGNIIGATSMAVGCYVDENGRIWWVQVFDHNSLDRIDPIMTTPLLNTENSTATPLATK